jgi:uridine kinase
MAHPPVEPHADPAADPSAVRAVVVAARTAAPRAGQVVVVAVDGRSGAGKSVLAAAVAAELGCPVVRLDDVYPGWDGLAEGVRIVTEEVLEPLSRGEPASHPTWDWTTGTWGPRVDVPAAPVVVLEGCGALAPTAAPYAAVAVWVEAPDEVRRARALARDGDLFAPHWERWARQEEALDGGDVPSAHADLVVRTGG